MEPITVDDTMRVNDELRNENVLDTDLLTLDQLNAAVPLYDDGNGAVLTLAPSTRPGLIAQTEFDRRMRTMPVHRIVKKVLDIPGICLCGGSVFRMFCGNGDLEGSDMDFYVTGMDPDDEKSLWEKVEEFLAVFRDGYASHHYKGETPVKIGKNVITITSCCAQAPKVQLILRVYPTIASVIQAFDVDPCCMAYDGRTTYLTRAAARVPATGRMVLDPSRRSTTYESRLVKYMERGVDLIMPHFELVPDMVDTLVSMPHLEFVVHAVEGTVATVSIQAKDSPKSDYDIVDEFDGEISESMLCVVQNRNMQNLSSGKHDYMFRVLTLDDTRDLTRVAIERGYMTYNDMLPMDTLVDMYRKKGATYQRMSLSSLSGLDVMTKFMGMSHSAAKRIFDLVYANRVVDMSSVLESLRTKGLGAYGRMCTDKFEMWIKTDPGRQWTASINPAFEAPAEYYGEHYCESPAVIASEADASDDEIGPDDDVCMICHDVIRPGETNLMVLVCGHKMHMMPIRHKCLGGFRWISDHDDKCPMCRRSVKDTSSRPAGTLPVRSATRRCVVAPAVLLDE